MIDDQVDASIGDEAVEHDWQAYHEFLTEGVSVLYVMIDGTDRAAVVVRKWKDSNAPNMVNLCVFLDDYNDRGNIPYGVDARGDSMLHWATSVHYAPPSERKTHTWHYMDEDEDGDELEADTIIDEIVEAG